MYENPQRAKIASWAREMESKRSGSQRTSRKIKARHASEIPIVNIQSDSDTDSEPLEAHEFVHSLCPGKLELPKRKLSIRANKDSIPKDFADKESDIDETDDDKKEMLRMHFEMLAMMVNMLQRLITSFMSNEIKRSQRLQRQLNRITQKINKLDYSFNRHD